MSINRIRKTRIIIDLMLVIAFLGLLAMPITSLGLAGFKTGLTSTEVLGDTTTQQSTQSTSSEDLKLLSY